MTQGMTRRGAWMALGRWLGWVSLILLTAWLPYRHPLRRRVLAGWGDAAVALEPYLRDEARRD
jgi:hypothetical protein